MASLKNMEKLLAKPYMREHFVAQCTVTKEDAKIFEHWAQDLGGLRWEAIVKFCGEVSCPISPGHSVNA